MFDNCKRNLIMATKKLPAAGELVKAMTSGGSVTMQILEGCRLKFKNPATFEVTSVYVTRTDARRFRAKIFRGGKCLLAQYVDGDDFLDVLRKISVNVVNL